MKKTIAVISCLCLVALFFVGCSKHSQAQATKDLQSALATINKANQGYIDSSHSQPVTYQQFRQKTLDSAKTTLQNVIASGTAEQQATAYSMLAKIQASSARILARHASNQYAQWQSASGNIITSAVAIDSAAGRRTLLKVNNSAGVKKLQSALAKLHGLAKELDKQISKQKALSQAQKNIHDKLIKQSNALASQAQEIHQKGFMATGGKKYDLYDQAAKLQSKAATLSFKASRHQVKRSTYLAKLKILETKKQNVLDGIKQVKKRIAEFNSETQKSNEAREAAYKQAQTSASQVAAEFKALQQNYANHIAQPYAKASKQIAKSVSLYKKAISQAAPKQRDYVQLDLLSTYLNQANIALGQAAAANGFGDLIKLISVNKNNWLKGDASDISTMTALLAQLKEQQQTAEKQAKEALKAAGKIATNLEHTRGNLAQVVKAQKTLLSQYQKQVQQLAG